MPSIAKEPRTCPCKLLPKSLSSFTAAEYGDIHSLSKIKDIASRTDDAGYNPLHYTAQFNHVAATAYLLQLGCPVDGMGHCGATPLHRAAFSGAIAAMKVLLEWNAPDSAECESRELDTERALSEDANRVTASSTLLKEKFCDLLARDTSFGDESTPLHKAVAGGRYLAVHMLLESFKERDEIRAKRSKCTIHELSRMPKPSWLQRGLLAKNRDGQTPLDLAHHFFNIQATERDAVARWDAIAGGPADWGKCVRLLENAIATNEFDNKGMVSKTAGPKAGGTDEFPNSRPISVVNRRVLPRLPFHLTNGVMACLDCNPGPGESGGVCLTASWQSTFQEALGDSASFCMVAPTKSPADSRNRGTAVIATMRQETTTSPTKIDEKHSTTKSTNNNEKPKANANTVHSKCGRCQKPTVALYQLPRVGILVCKPCRRLAKS